MSASTEPSRSVLLIAYHYPPVRGSSGLQRTLKFSEYLPEFGWRPIVLSAHTRAYRATTEGQAAPPGAIVERAFALDTSRHLSLLGRYPKLLALPDRWSSWWLGGVFSGLRLIREHRPSVIWSTYPIATAHCIGLALSALSGLPWVADFRDPMLEPNFPTDPLMRRIHACIEGSVARRCQRAVFTTPGAHDMYAARYPGLPRERWSIIPNGFDEPDFAAAETGAPSRSTNAKRVLVHSGLLYRSARDPRPFFAALAALKRSGKISGERLGVVLRATGEDDYYRQEIERVGVGDIVSLEPHQPYHEALAEMLSSDGLLLFQSAGCNHQVPAKAYEYIRARRPIFALTDAAGDTAELLRRFGCDAIAPLLDSDRIAIELARFLDRLDAGKDDLATPEEIDRLSRRQRTRELAAIFDALDGRSPAVERAREIVTT